MPYVADDEGAMKLMRSGSTSGTAERIAKFGNSTVENSRLYELGDATNPRVGVGGSTAAFPGLKRSATALGVRLADDSADAPLTAAAITASGAVAAPSHTASADAAGATELPRLSQLHGIIIRKELEGLDAKALATTAIFTTENAGRSFYATQIFVEATLITTHTEVASLSIGSDAEVDEILGITAMTGLTATGLYIPVPIVAAKKVAPNTAISVKITTAADAAAATYRIVIIGHYD